MAVAMVIERLERIASEGNEKQVQDQELANRSFTEWLAKSAVWCHDRYETLHRDGCRAYCRMRATAEQ